MRRYPFYQADVFTEVIFGGNPVVVFPSAEGLSDEEMQQIARETNMNETVFVVNPTNGKADIKLRFFSPSTELPYSVHPAIGAHVVLAHLEFYEILGPLTRIFHQLKIGTLPVDLITNADGVTDRVVLTQDEARHGSIYEDVALVADALGVDESAIDTNFPMQVYSTGLPSLIIPMTSLDAVQNIELNPAVFRDICKSLSVTNGVVFTTETMDNAHHVHVRNFAPLIGIHEDPASGSAAGALGAYLLGKGVFDYEEEFSTTHFVIEQGHSMHRPSLIEVEVDVVEGVITEVRIGGQVVIAMEGTLLLQ